MPKSDIYYTLVDNEDEFVGLKKNGNMLMDLNFDNPSTDSLYFTTLEKVSKLFTGKFILEIKLDRRNKDFKMAKHKDESKWRANIFTILKSCSLYDIDTYKKFNELQILESLKLEEYCVVNEKYSLLEYIIGLKKKQMVGHNLFLFFKNLWTIAVVNNKVDVLNWAYENKYLSDGPFLNGNVHSFDWAIAAAHGRIDILKWAHDNKLLNNYVFRGAAEVGDIDVLQWGLDNKYDFINLICDRAAANGRLDVLKWAIEHGAKMSDVCGAEVALN